jgi:glycosyltransferase involved in cell wall biosynthesis
MPGYVTLIAAITGLGGLQMVMLGVIGEYIGRIYYETKHRPHYLLKQSNIDPIDRPATQTPRSRQLP